MEQTLNKRQQQYQKTLELLRRVVDELVQEKGFDAMRIKDIADRAGLSEGAFYHYFQSKNDILFDRYLRTQEAFRAAYEEKWQYMNEIAALLELVDQIDEGMRSRVMDILIPYETAYISNYQRWVEKMPDYGRQIVLTIVEKGQRAGTISKRYAAQEIAEFINAYMEGAVAAFSCCQGKKEKVKHRILKEWIQALAE